MTIDFNISPFYDDFDEDKKFYRILFNPGRAVQARELTQLQTILSTQTKKISEHLFKDGSQVIPGQITYDGKLPYVKLQPTFSSVAVDVTDFIGNVITGATTGVKAVVVDARPIEGSDPITLFVKYTNSGTNGTTSVFANGEVITTTAAVPHSATLLASAATGVGTRASIQSGWYFVAGVIAKVLDQSIILDKYTTLPSYKVGLTVSEAIVDNVDDSSLLDNAQGTSNFAAPGADRYSITLTLTKKALSDTNTEGFVELMRLEDGILTKRVDRPSYAYLGDEMALRTYEESGNYTVKSFGLDVREHLDDENGNGGKYTAANGGTESKLAIGMEPGLAYVKGYRVQTIGTTWIETDKARDYFNLNNLNTTASVGMYTFITNVYGFPDFTTFGQVSLRGAATVTRGTLAGSEIGTARIKGIEFYSGTPGLTTAVYKLFLFDIRMSGGNLFSATKQLGFTSTPNFTADPVLISSQAVLQDTGMPLSIFQLPYTPVRKIRASDNSVDTTYSVKRVYSGTTNGSGNISFNAGTDEIFDSFNTTDYIATVTTGGSAGTILNLTGLVTLSGTPTGKTVTLALTGTYASVGIKLSAPIVKQIAAEKSKTLQSASLQFSSPTSSMSLGVADGYKITGVYDSGNPTINATSSDEDISYRYSLDSGQRDSYYDLASANLISGQPAPKGRLLITFQYFTHGAGDYFSVDSYTGQVAYDKIPSYTASNGQVFYLRDCMDFRPRIDNTGANFTGGGASTIEFVKQNTNVRHDFSYYLNRIDKVYVDSNGFFGVTKGIPDDVPSAPGDKDGTMTLYTMSIPAYTFGPITVSSVMTDNRRYTMRDIGSIDKRVSNLEYYTSLTLLEKDASDLQIIDPITGLNRFKNGILVDGFKSFAVSDTNNADFSCALDTSKGILRAPFAQNNVDLEYSSSLSSNVQKTGDLITLPYTSVAFISQPKASRSLNINPYNVFTFIGSIGLSPASDNWKDTTRIPDQVINEPDNIAIIQELADSSGLTGTHWNDWQTTWTGVSTTTEHQHTTLVGNVSQKQVVWEGDLTTGELNGIISENLVAGGRRQDTFVTTQQVGQTRTGTETTLVISEQTQSIGDRVVSTDTIPYMRSIDIAFSARRMKPSTKLYPFFDDVEVSAYCKPVSGAYGAPLITDATGSLDGIFTVPNNSTLKFRTGDRVFKLIDESQNIQANASTYSLSTFTSAGTLDTLQNTIISTRVAQLESTAVTENRVATNIDFQFLPIDPLAQTFFVQEDNGCFVTKLDLFFAKKDANLPVTVQIRTVENGVPSSVVVPFGEVVLNAADVNVSSDASVATTVTFPSPIYLGQATQYSFVVMSDSDGYELFIATVGQTDLNTSNVISEQPYVGVMFMSQNASTWTPDQLSDIKFTLYKAAFDISTGGVAVFQNEPVEDIYALNPFITTSGLGTVRVQHRNHGFANGSKVILTTSTGTYNGISSANLSGTFVVSAVDLNGYTITASSSATATVTGACGGAVRIQRNIPYDIIVPNIQTLTLTKTAIDWSMISTTGKHPHGNQTPYIMDSSSFSIQMSENNLMDNPKIIASAKNELDMMAGSKSLKIGGILNSDHINVSPIIDTDRMSVITVANLIDAPTSSGDQYGYTAETAKVGGSSRVKYVSTPTTLEDTAIGLSVYMNVSRPVGTTVDLYYRVKSQGVTADINTLDWTIATPNSSAVTSDNPDKFYEYSYLIDDLEPFTTFAFKIVLRSADSTAVPLIKDFRTIALGT